MTGGCVVVLGETGSNFGAGMTGGVAYVLDESGAFPARANPGTVTWSRLEAADAKALRALLQEHKRCTGSRRAAELLASWKTMRGRFWKVGARPAETPGDAPGGRREEAAPAGEVVPAPVGRGSPRS